MQKIILCEGKTDAVLLGYYLMKTNDWVVDKTKKKPRLSNNNNSEVFTWFSKNNEFLAIWGIGGNSWFEKSIKKIEKINYQASNENEIFQKVVILMDRDFGNVDNLIATHLSYFSSTPDGTISNNTWIQMKLKNSFETYINFQIAFLVIPFDQEGALETFLIEAMKEIERDRLVIEKCEEFINDLESEVYLTTPRLKLKAKFSVILSIFSPEKVFDFIDSLLMQINWEGYKNVQSSFALFDEI